MLSAESAIYGTHTENPLIGEAEDNTTRPVLYKLSQSPHVCNYLSYVNHLVALRLDFRTRQMELVS